MMDHALQMISYIADIGEIIVLMARRKRKGQDDDTTSNSGTQKKCLMICHVFISDDVSLLRHFCILGLLTAAGGCEGDLCTT